MKIHLAADHAGFKLKEEVKKFLQENGHKVIDHGAWEYNQQDDYPDLSSLQLVLSQKIPVVLELLWVVQGKEKQWQQIG